MGRFSAEPVPGQRAHGRCSVVIIYSIVSRHGYEGLVLTTLMAGILLVIFGFLRLGALVKYIPYPVTTGFTTDRTADLLTDKGFLFGLPLVDTPPEFFDKWGAYAQNAMDFSPSTLGVAAFTLLVILIVRRKIPKLPAPVVAVFLSTLLVWLFSLPTDTIGSRFGTLPTGFPDFALPQGVTFERIRELFPDALTIALLAGIESLLACVVADSMTGDRHTRNMELISQGIGNGLGSSAVSPPRAPLPARRRISEQARCHPSPPLCIPVPRGCGHVVKRY